MELVNAKPYREAGMRLWRTRTWAELGMMAGVNPEVGRRIVLGQTRSIRQSTALKLSAWLEAYERETV